MLLHNKSFEWLNKGRGGFYCEDIIRNENVFVVVLVHKMHYAHDGD